MAIRGGSPGHCAIVVDVGENAGTGTRVFLLAQSFMPAQEIHVLKNPTDAKLSPWYSARIPDALRTPEYTFARHELRRFRP